MIEIRVGSKSFILTDEEEKVLSTDILDIAEWVENLLRQKARQLMDKIIAEQTEYNPRKLTPEKKKEIIASLHLKTAKEYMTKIKEDLKSKEV